MPIEIAPYDATWPDKFHVERKRLWHGLQPHVTAIEHIGSTAVPGLAAKPIIDILIGVSDLATANRHCVPAMEDLGYEYRPDFEVNFPDRRFFWLFTDEGIRTHNVHMVVEEGPFWKRHLLFRDYLRAHPEEAVLYENFKKELAQKHESTDTYARDKTSFIRAMEARAGKWRACGEKS